MSEMYQEIRELEYKGIRDVRELGKIGMSKIQLY